MIAEEIWDAVTDADLVDAPKLLKRFSERIGLPKLRELMLELEGFGKTEAESDGLDDSKVRTVADLLDIAANPESALQWLVPDVMQKDGITIISAPSGNGKTWLALDLCRHLTRGETEEYGKWLGKYDLPRGSCLYMDEENGDATIADRVGKLGFGRPNNTFRSWSDSGFRLENAQARLGLIRRAKEWSVQVLVFDSLKAFHERDENSATEMRRVGNWLREFVLAGFTVIALHHDKKGNGENGSEQDRTRGSGDITAFSQTVLGLTQEGSVFKLAQRKVRGVKRDETPITYMLSNREDKSVFVDVDGGTTLAEDLRRQRQEVAMETHMARVLEAEMALAARGAKKTIRAIADEAGMSTKTVSDVLRFRAAAAGKKDKTPEE